MHTYCTTPTKQCIHIVQHLQNNAYTLYKTYETMYTYCTRTTKQCIHIVQELQNNVYILDKNYKTIIKHIYKLTMTDKERQGVNSRFWQKMNIRRTASKRRSLCIKCVNTMTSATRADVISNYNRVSVCLYVVYVNVFLLDGLHLGRQTFRD